MQPGPKRPGQSVISSVPKASSTGQRCHLDLPTDRPYNDHDPSIDDMSTEVLYRKWRPRSFSDVVGQEPVTRTIRNAVANSKIAHAYLLCGPRGTGKTSLGRLVAKASTARHLQRASHVITVNFASPSTAGSQWTWWKWTRQATGELTRSASCESTSALLRWRRLQGLFGRRGAHAHTGGL